MQGHHARDWSYFIQRTFFPRGPPPGQHHAGADAASVSDRFRSSRSRRWRQRTASTPSTWPSEHLRASRGSRGGFVTVPFRAGRRRAEAWVNRLRPVHDADQTSTQDGVPVSGVATNEVPDFNRSSTARERLRVQYGGPGIEVGIVISPRFEVLRRLHAIDARRHQE